MNSQRRDVLRWLAFSGVTTALGLGATGIEAAIAAESPQTWGYVGDGAPTQWGSLSARYQICQTGQQQSPIDLNGNGRPATTALAINYQVTPLKVLNTGLTMQVNVPADNRIELDGKRFDLLQFHFHYPSEHRIGGEAFPMELHLVHGNEQRDLVVLGVFLQLGAENAALKPIWQAMPHRKSEIATVAATQVDLTGLLPGDLALFRYSGSLTTPPCSEPVQWVVFQTPVSISAAQLAEFKAVFAPNARSLQPRNQRWVWKSTGQLME